METMLDRALALAGEGFRVFPLSPGGKTPALEADWKRVATRDAAKVKALWTDPVTGWDQPFNIGIATGDGLVVLDVDMKNGKDGEKALRLLQVLNDDLPPTLEARTASGGRHLYFDSTSPLGNSASRLADGIDTRGEGGFVVAPGSIVDGVAYEWVRRTPRAAVPDWMGAMVGPPTSPRKGEVAPLVDDDDPAAIARATAWLRDSAPDHGTFAVACKVKDFGVSEAMCGELMLEHWRDARGLGKPDEHVLFRVANAYRYGQNPVGISSPEAEFEPVDVVDRRTKPPKPKLYFETWEEITPSESKPFLIDDWYDRGAMIVTYGESNTGKTHVVLNQCFAIASGQRWAEHDTSAGLVVYVAAEGGRGVRNRIVAYKRRFDVAKIPLVLVPCQVDMLRPAGDTKALVDLVKGAEDTFGVGCAMIVLDTLARVLAGGDENAPVDMGLLVKHCDFLRAGTGAAVHLIHHSGKNKAAGARGHSSLRAATDTEIEVADGRIAAKKQRDMERNLEVGFRLDSVPLHTDARGKTVTAAVAVVSKAAGEFETKLSQEASAFFTVLADLNDEQGGVSWKTWWQAAADAQTEAGRTADSRQTFIRRRKELVDAGLVKATNGSKWVASELSTEG